MPARIACVVLDKPSGVTSREAAARAARAIGARRFGYVGTLDPFATGVLPVFFGRATKLIPLFEKKDKVYSATFVFGVETDTYDLTGRVVCSRPASVSRAVLEQLLRHFEGEIWHEVPVFSAARVEGKRLYDIARAPRPAERDAVVLPMRKVKIYSIKLLDIEGSKEARLVIHCSSGTYVRSLAHEMGKRLGCGGAVKELRRLRDGDFDESQVVSLEELERACRKEGQSLPRGVYTLEEVCGRFVEVKVRSEFVRRVLNGNPIESDGWVAPESMERLRTIPYGGPMAITSEGKEVLAVYRLWRGAARKGGPIATPVAVFGREAI